MNLLIFLKINSDFLDFKSLESIIINSIYENKKNLCKICKISYLSDNITYEIAHMPNYLFFIYDFNTYNDLIIHKNELIKFIHLEFNFNKIYHYFFQVGITMTSSNHYNSFFKNYNNSKVGNNFKLENNKIYFHDGMRNNGNFYLYNNINDLFNSIPNLVPYIIIYGLNHWLNVIAIKLNIILFKVFIKSFNLFILN